jgi:hypothetical protein
MTRRLLVVAALASLLACGLKNSPLPPETVKPESPSDLTARSVVEGVELTWRRPTKYSGGKRMNDLDYMAVERAPTDGSSDYVEVGRVVVTDRERFRQERKVTWIDTNAPVGSRFFYRIVAVTTDRYRSVPSEPVAVTVGEQSGQGGAEKPTD